MRIAVVHEHPVGLPEAARPLAELGHELVSVSLAEADDPTACLRRLGGADVVVHAVPLASGSSALWAAALAERARLPYLGPSLASLVACTRRELWRAVCRAAGVPVPWGRSVPAISALRGRRVPLPAAVGRPERARMAWSRQDLLRAVEQALGEEGGPVWVEEATPGRRFAVALLGERALAAAEVDQDGTVRRRGPLPAALAGTLVAHVQAVAPILLSPAPGLVWFAWDGLRAPRLLRPDPAPDLSPTGLFAACAAREGWSLAAVWRTALAWSSPAGTAHGRREPGPSMAPPGR